LNILADVVVIIHFLWILFLLFGAVWGVRNAFIRILHISGLIFALVIQAFDWYCPLTDLEIWLRAQHSPGISYTGSFIVRYIEKIVYVEVPRPLIIICTGLIVAFNLMLYLKRRVKGFHV
jgi:Protein of Unknown function (DUF2784)